MYSRVISPFQGFLSIASATLLMAVSLATQAADFSCQFTVTSQWGTGASASLTITNTTGQTLDWEEINLSFPQDSGVQVSSSWDASRTGSNPYSFQPLAWNRTLQPAQSAEIGMQLAKAGTSEFPAGSLSGDCSANTSPVAVIDISMFEALVTLDGSNSHDADGDELTYQWTVDGAAYDSGAVLSSRYFSKGTYTVGLTVSDGELSHTVSDTFTMSYPPTVTPAAEFGYTEDSLTVFFNASRSRAGSGSIYFHWEFGDGTTSMNYFVDPTITHTYAEPGEYDITLLVYDSSLNTKEITQTIVVTGDANIPPTAVMTLGGNDGVIDVDGRNSIVEENEVLTCELQVDDREPEILPYCYSLYKNYGAGEHTVRLTVSDGFASDTITQTYTSAGISPVAAISFEINGDTVTFDGSGSYSPVADRSIVSYEWEFGDGKTATGVSPTNTYQTYDTPAHYSVTLMVFDNTGAWNRHYAAVIIQPADVNDNVQCTYEITNAWGNSFEANVRIVNNGETAVNNWSVDVTYPDASSLSSWWDADISGAGPYTADGKTWNADLQPGGIVQFGVIGTNGSATPAVPALTGSTCEL